MEVIETRPLCCFPGCKKLAWQDADGKQHECCGMFHHVLLMERRAAGEDGSSSDHSSLDDGGNAGKCQLSSCGNAAKEGHQFCSKSCVLERLREVARSPSWKKCKLPGCLMPAYVEQTLQGVRKHDFCGWSHAKEASLLPAAETDPYKVLSEADIAEALWEWTRYGTQGAVKVDADFYKKHPWDIVPPDKDMTYVIAKLNRQSKSRKRSNTTEKGYYWKQQGREDSFKFSEAHVVKKHRTYYMAGEQKTNVKFTLIEYVLDENGETGDWAVCKVSRKACSEPKVKKDRGSKRTRGSANGGPEASVVDPVEASDPVDSILRELPDLPDIPLMEFPEIEYDTA